MCKISVDQSKKLIELVLRIYETKFPLLHPITTDLRKLAPPTMKCRLFQIASSIRLSG